MDIDLVRRATDETVLSAFLAAEQLTRAELAEFVGISRPTASESVRRLTESGLVVEGGRQTGGRGRSGTYCQVAPGVAFALAAHAGPGEVVVELLDAAHTADKSGIVAQFAEPIGLTTTVADLRAVFARLIAHAEAAAGTDVDTRVVSVAAPVDVRAQAVVRIDASPFVLDEGSLASVVGGAGVLDNDVAWAAAAELTARAAALASRTPQAGTHAGPAVTSPDPADPADADGEAGRERERAAFLHIFLGAGLGAALVDAGRPVQGARGLAGEIAHVLTVGPGGRAMTFSEALRALGLGVAGTSALDVDAVRARLDDPDVLAAVVGVVASCVTLLDPGLVVLSGPWGGQPALVAAVGSEISRRMPRRVTIAGPLVREDPSLTGARARALQLARERLLSQV